MKRDFTYDIYNDFLKSLIDIGYHFFTVRDYFKTKPDPDKKFVILRHDVDKRPVNSLVKAQIENNLGIRSTYYFRTLDCSFDKEIISNIVSMGHEFGYHYEDLTLAKGNLKKAYQLFRNNLEKFRSVEPVSTICMHGSPLSRWDNREIWNEYDYRKHDVVAEPYFDINFSDVFYFTDTGRKWNNSGSSVRDKVRSQLPDKYSSLSTLNLITLAKKDELPNKVMINTHPQRWTNSYFLWFNEFVSQNFKNVIKSLVVKGNKQKKVK